MNVVPLSLSQPQNCSRKTPESRCLADYSISKEVGEGSFSTVYYATEKEGKKREIALKICMKSLILKNKMVAYIQREKEALVLLNREENVHPLIVTLFATFQDAESLYFVLSYAKYGDLLSIIEKQPGKRLKVEDARYYAANLLSALFHIHSLGIIHRDVKPENLLVKEDGRIVLTDFGSSKFLKDYEKNEEETEKKPARRRSFVGTAHFVSPELLTGSQMGPYSDFWAFAVSLYFFLAGEYPFDDPSEYLIFRRIQDLLYKFPESSDFDAHAKDLIERILVIDTSNRLSSTDLQNHQFFESIDFSKIGDIEPPKIYLL